MSFRYLTVIATIATSQIFKVTDSLRHISRGIAQIAALSVLVLIINTYHFGCFSLNCLGWMLRSTTSMKKQKDVHGPDSEYIWNATHRKAVVSLRSQTNKSLSTQECYFWYVYERYNEQAAAKTITKVMQGETIDVDDKVDTSNAVRCATLPIELWHIICSHLHLKELQAMRLTSKEMSDVAAEFMMTTIRIDTNFEACKRVKYIAKHPNLRKGVRRFLFEAGLQADMGCIHMYKR